MSELTRDVFEERRAKESLAFLVVKFLKAYVAFEGIHAAFRKAEADGCLASCGVFEQVRELEETLAFDLKEMAHGLFRNRSVRDARQHKPAARISRRMLRELKASIEMRSIDSYLGTGYHLLAILKESMYQLQHYAPAYEQEKAEVASIEDLARRLKYAFSPEEARELEHLRSLAELSMKLSAETEALSRRMATRCRDLFQGTAQVILGYLEGAGENEVLVQNLLQNRDLLNRVYGAGTSERIFLELCRGRDVAGTTGVERARSYVQKHCGNVDGLSGGAASRGPAA
ncbi:MAG: hypothetical protein NTU62_05220 [Spirochaetes bacterium]|nr:hypothetical protein [Spirochaetota bacterium]